MTSKQFWCCVLITVLCTVLTKPAQASGYPSAGAIVGGIAAVAGAIVIVAVVVIHKSTAKRTITGCINSGKNGMSVTDEKDNQSYAVSGNTNGITLGNRMTLQGKKIKTPSKMLAWETTRVTKDYGVCRP